MNGLKFDIGKTDWSLMPWVSLTSVAKVVTFGAKKYDRDNWRKVEGWRERYFAAALRHLVAWYLGERADDESGESPLAHCVCDTLFLMELSDAIDKTKPQNSDVSIPSDSVQLDLFGGADSVPK